MCVDKDIGSLDVLVTDTQAMKGVDGYAETAEKDCQVLATEVFGST